MAFVTISGFPCSGKSGRAEQLRAHLEARFKDPSYEGPQLKVVVVSDETLNIPRSAYNGEQAFSDVLPKRELTGPQMDELKNLQEALFSPRYRDKWDKIPF